MKMPIMNDRKGPESKSNDINTIAIHELTPIEMGFTDFSDTKAYIRFIKDVERLIRKSSEYRSYIKFLKTECNLNRGTFLSQANDNEKSKVSIEFHHYPFSLYDLVDIVTSSYYAVGVNRISPYMLANEVMELHYKNMIGLVPLTKTVHELAHSGEIFISLDNVYGNVNKFLSEFKVGIDSDYLDKLSDLIDLTDTLKDYKPDILDKQMTYIDMETVNNLLEVDLKEENLA